MSEKQKQKELRLLEVTAWFYMFGLETDINLRQKAYNFVSYEAEPLCNQIFIKEGMEAMYRKSQREGS